MMADSQQMKTTEGILFGVYNTTTGYFQNVLNYKNADEICRLMAINLSNLAILRCSLTIGNNK